MKKIIISIIALIVAVICLAMPVHAELSMPQVFSWEDDIARDFNGDPITDCWAYDPNQETDKFVKLDSQGKLIEQKATFEIEPETTEKGWVQFEAIVPEELKGKTVIVSIMGPAEYEVKLYDINNYTAMQEVLVGTYRVNIASIAGDLKNEFPSKFDGEIVVYPNSTAAVVKVEFEDVNKEEPVIETIPEPEPEPIEEDNGIGLIQIIFIIILGGLAGTGLYVFKKIKENE